MIGRALVVPVEGVAAAVVGSRCGGYTGHTGCCNIGHIVHCMRRGSPNWPGIVVDRMEPGWHLEYAGSDGHIGQRIGGIAGFVGFDRIEFVGCSGTALGSSSGIQPGRQLDSERSGIVAGTTPGSGCMWIAEQCIAGRMIGHTIGIRGCSSFAGSCIGCSSSR